MQNSFFHYQKQVNRLNVTLVTINDSHRRQKTKNNLSDFADYRNSGQKLNFLGDLTYAPVQCFMMSQYVADLCPWSAMMHVVMKAMHITSTHNILPDSSFSDV